MKKQISRREFLRLTALGVVGGIGAACAPTAQVPQPAATQAPATLAPTEAAVSELIRPYMEANIDWRQFDGETIHVMVTPAHYFNKFRAITPQFTELTGIEVTFDVVPPREMREKAVLDLGAGSGTIYSHTADPMYLPLYEFNGWTDPLDDYINDTSITDAAWFDLEDVVPLWRAHNTVNDRLYGMPVEGEATIHIYRTDIYEQAGVQRPETLEQLREVAEATHTDDVPGLALRGFRGAGQNMYIYPSLFRSWGGEWFDSDGNPTVNSDAGIGALEYYVDVLNNYAPAGIENWNWPEIMEAFAQGDVVQYIDANSTASIIEDPTKSEVAGQIGYQRWPMGPADKRVTSIWNWAMPINAALPEQKKKATWLYIQWLACRPTQLRSATFKETEDAVIRTGVNRLSIWEDPEYRAVIGFTPDYADVVLTSLREDTDPNWRPRVPQWPDIGETMAVAIQAALVGQKSPDQALNDANAEITEIMGA